MVLLKRVDEQWLMGKVGDKEGIFPQNFVDIIHPLHDEVVNENYMWYVLRMYVWLCMSMHFCVI